MSQFGPTNYYMHNPSAASIVTNPAFPTERILKTDNGDILVQGQANITACQIVCAQPCTEQQWTITFPDADYGDCNSCPIQVGFLISRDRDTDFPLANHLHSLTRLPMLYPTPPAGGTVTGTVIATYFENLINNITPQQNDIHDFWHIRATRSGNVLTIIMPCPVRVRLYALEDNGGYIPTFANTVVGQEAFLTKEQIKRMLGKDINQIPGQWLSVENFSDCENACILSLSGCYDACDNINIERKHTVHLGNAATKVQYDILINANAPGYAAFIAALAAFFTTNCSSLIPVYGSSTPFDSGTAAQWAVGINIDDSGYVFSATSQFTISNGVVSLTVTAATPAALAAALVADPSTGITSAYAAPNLTVTGFGTNPIVIRQTAP